MNTLTAVRSFGKPGYCPAKKVRIFANRLYMVTMQNTEHDQGDGYYLADGEYQELVTGDEARRRRDAHLNHCNGVEEYTGPVYAVYHRPYGGERVECELAAGKTEAERISAHVEASRQDHLERLLQEAQMHERRATPEAYRAASLRSGIGSALAADDPGWAEGARRNIENAAECYRQVRDRADWHIEIRHVA